MFVYRCGIKEHQLCVQRCLCIESRPSLSYWLIGWLADLYWSRSFETKSVRTLLGRMSQIPSLRSSVVLWCWGILSRSKTKLLALRLLLEGQIWKYESIYLQASPLPPISGSRVFDGSTLQNWWVRASRLALNGVEASAMQAEVRVTPSAGMMRKS